MELLWSTLVAGSAQQVLHQDQSCALMLQEFMAGRTLLEVELKDWILLFGRKLVIDEEEDGLLHIVAGDF
jgi:hypothetical protein